MADRYFVFSTMSADVRYTDYDLGEKGAPARVIRDVLIRGGAHVTDPKTLLTPKGIMTEVSGEDMKFLQSNGVFNRHLEAGVIKVERVNENPEKVAKDMKEKDAGAQATGEEMVQLSGKRAKK